MSCCHFRSIGWLAYDMITAAIALVNGGGNGQKPNPKVTLFNVSAMDATKIKVLMHSSNHPPITMKKFK